MSKDEKHFDFINDIFGNKINLIKDGTLREEQYNAFMINRGLSQYLDTVLFADEMNMMKKLPVVMQYDYYLNLVPARKRPKVKWAKRVEHEDTLAIARWFGVNLRQAERITKILRNETVQSIKAKVQRLENV